MGFLFTAGKEIFVHFMHSFHEVHKIYAKWKGHVCLFVSLHVSFLKPLNLELVVYTRSCTANLILVHIGPNITHNLHEAQIKSTFLKTGQKKMTK
jgi:hypothetical protein